MTGPFSRPDAPESPPVTGGVRRFIASYDSECERCSNDIGPGDDAGYIDDDDRASCPDCCDEAEES